MASKHTVKRGNRCALKVEGLEERITPAPGSLDPSFNNGNLVFDQFTGSPSTNAKDLAKTPSGGLVVLGSSSVDGVVEYNANGFRTQTFGSNGFAQVRFYAANVINASQYMTNVDTFPDGRVVVGGFAQFTNGSTTTYQGGIEVLLANGSPDFSFGFQGHVLLDVAPNSFITDLVALPDGRITVAGVSNASFGAPKSTFVTTLTKAGNRDTSWGSSAGVSTFNLGTTDNNARIARGPDGRIYLAEEGTTGTNTLLRVTALDGATGKGVPGFGTNNATDIHFADPVSEWNGITVAGNGRIVVSASLLVTNPVTQIQIVDAGLRVLHPDGSPDLLFGTNGTVRVHTDENLNGNFILNTIAALPSGDIIAFGTTNQSYNGNAYPKQFVVIRPDGSLQTQFNGTGVSHFWFSNSSFQYESSVGGLAISQDGKINILMSELHSTGSGTTTVFGLSRVTGLPNTSPMLFSVGNLQSVTVEAGQTRTLSFSLDDAETPAASLNFSAVVTNIPNPLNTGMVIGGAGGVRTLTFSPALGSAGTTAILVNVTDAGGLTNQISIALIVTSPTAVVPPVVVPPVVVPPVVSPSITPSVVVPPAIAPSTPANRPRLLALGTDVGPIGTARLMNPDGSVRFEVSPYGPGFTGGMRVAVGDVNGDGTPDLITVPGPGAAPVVWVFDGQNGNPLGSFLAFEASFLGGAFVAAADLDLDGKVEIIVSPDQSGGPRVRVLRGADGSVTVADFYGIDDPNFRGGVRVAVGDVNGDRVPDLIVAAGFGGGPRIAVFDGAGLLANSSAPPKLMADFYAFEPSLRNGAYAALGDLNGDGYADLMFGAGPGGGPRVLALDSYRLLSGLDQSNAVLFDQFAGDVNDRGGVRVTVGDDIGSGYGYVIADPNSGGAISAVNGIDGSPLSRGVPVGALSGSVAALMPPALGGANGVPGTATWQPSDNWLQVSTKFTPPLASDYVAPPTVPPGSPYPTPDYSGGYTAQFKGSVLATPVAGGNASRYTGTINATVTIQSQSSSDSSGYLGLMANVHFTGNLTAEDPANPVATLPLDVSINVTGKLLQSIATNGPRNQAVGGNLDSIEPGKTLAMRKVSVFDTNRHEFQANFSFQAKSGGYIVQKTAATTGYFYSSVSTPSTATGTPDPSQLPQITGTYEGSISAELTRYPSTAIPIAGPVVLTINNIAADTAPGDNTGRYSINGTINILDASGILSLPANVSGIYIPSTGYIKISNDDEYTASNDRSSYISLEGSLNYGVISCQIVAASSAYNPNGYFTLSSNTATNATATLTKSS